MNCPYTALLVVVIQIVSDLLDPVSRWIKIVQRLGADISPIDMNAHHRLTGLIDKIVDLFIRGQDMRNVPRMEI